MGEFNTRKNTAQLIKDYESCPISQKEYVIDVERFFVTRHFVGNKDINQVITELAYARADREMGL